MSQAHFDAFMADVKRRAHIKFTESKSSIRGLVEFLRTDLHHPQPLTTDQAIAKLANPRDPRLEKYQPCIRRVVTVWGRPTQYGDAATQVVPLAPQDGNPSGNLVVFDNHANVQRYAAAYYKARFFHGSRHRSTDESMQRGLKIDESCSPIGATDPGRSKIPGGGPIFLGEIYSISEDYGGTEDNILRVFLDNTRVIWPLPDRGPGAKFVRGDPKVYRDLDNPRARYTMADIPGIAMFTGSHTDVILRQPGSARTAEIVRAIGSHDGDLPKGTLALVNLHDEAIRQHLISDRATDDRNPR